MRHMLKIIQVFNNNVALVELPDKRQAVAKGRGIAFQKKHDDLISTHHVEKMFYLETATSRQNLYFLLKDIPIDVVTTTYEIIDVAQHEYHLKVLDYIYITLSDHIYGAYKRFKDGSYIDSQVPDFHIQYPAEYAVAKKALTIIYDNLGIRFPVSEANNIALHFINATGENGTESKMNDLDESAVTEVVQKVLYDYGILRLTSNDNYYDRFMIHLQYLIDRLKSTNSRSTIIIPQVSVELKSNYPKSYAIASEIFNKLKKELFPELNEDELIYFIVHIQRLTMEKPKKRNKGDI